MLSASHTVRLLAVVTIAFHKPFDVLSQFTDRSETPRKTLADFIDLDYVYGAGRLDRDSEGLLILSDDARLRSLLTNPQHHIFKKYWVQVEGICDSIALKNLQTGVMVKGKKTKPAKAKLLNPAPLVQARSVPIRVRKTVPDSWIELQIREGRNRQVRRMTAAVGFPTLRLVRQAIGPIELGELKCGEWRELSPEEISQLINAAR